MNTSISSNPKDAEGKPHYHPGEVIQTRSLLLRGVDQNMSHTGSGDAEVTTVSAGGQEGKQEGNGHLPHGQGKVPRGRLERSLKEIMGTRQAGEEEKEHSRRREQ